MASVTVKVSTAGPTDNAGTCEVLYEVTSATDVAPEIFVVKQMAPAYKGAAPMIIWQHVAYADELTNVSTSPVDGQTSLVRKAVVNVRYPSLTAASEAIDSIRRQIKRLMNELTTLEEFNTVQTWTISSDQQ